MDSARDTRIGDAIAEYLTAVDSRQPFDVVAWLSKHDDVGEALKAFLADQSQLHRLATGNSATPQLSTPAGPEAALTDKNLPASNLSTRKESVDGAKIRIEIGGKLGPYQLVSELGKGGMGTVYAARHQSLGRMVALKVMAEGDQASESDRRRFRREAEAVAKLDHPSIVPIFEVGQHHGWDYFTMKLLPGGSLRDWMIETSEISLRQIGEAMAEIALGLQHAHQRGILHRDLKPSNLLLDEQQRPCLVDFGLAKQLTHDQTTVGQVLGTPAYMAPEQLYGETTTFSDVYGLGATLYSLITKRPPFYGKTLLELSEQIRQQSPAPIRKYCPELPRDLEIICLKCLEKTPEQRYSSAAEFAADLRRWLNGEAILARPVSLQAQAWMWCRRHPLVSGLAATLMTVVVGATVVLSLLLNQSHRLGREAELNAQQAQTNAVIAEANAEAAQAAAAEATQQRDRARQVLDVMTSTVAYEWLAGQQTLTTTQQKFLRQSVDYYQELAAESADALDPEQLWWLAQTQHRLATLVGRLGDRNEAALLAEQSSQTLGKIPPDWQALQVLLLRSQVLHDQQTWLADTGQLQRSLAVMHQASDVLDAVLKLDPENWEAAMRLGQLRVDLGTRYRFLEKVPEAVQALQEAVDWNTQLMTQRPNLPGIRRQLGISLRTLGLAQMQARDYVAAERSMLTALELQRELAEQATHERRFVSDVAYTLDNLGIVKDNQGELTTAADYISQAVALRRDLLQITPGEETLQRALTQSYLNLSSIVKRQADWELHRNTLQQTLEHVQQAQTRFPSVAEYRYWEWVAKLGLAENHSQALEIEPALALLNEVIPLIEAAPIDSNSSRILRNQLLRAWNARAPLFSTLGNHQAALADWQFCIDQTQAIEQANHRLCQAVAYVKAGQAERAVQIVEAVMQAAPGESDHPLEANLHYNIACVRALMVSQTDDLDDRQTLLSQATDAVEACLRLGGKSIHELGQDPDLSELRDFPPFQALLTQ